MNRRQAVQKVALLMGGTVLGAELFIQTGCKTSPKKNVSEADAKILKDIFTKDEIAYLDEIAETILPRTATPGAKDANVGQFMNVMVSDCYTSKDQEIFKSGMATIEKSSKGKYGDGFMKLTNAQRKELITAIDKEAKEYVQTLDYKSQKEVLAKEEHLKDSLEESKGNFGYEQASMPKHYFSMMKELTLLGFFTSEPGATKALRYLAVPGKYDPCMPYKQGDKAWAT